MPEEQRAPQPDAAARSRAAEIAAREVEKLISTAQAAAAQVKERAEADAERIRERARRQADEQREEARKEAVLLGQDARVEAERMLDAARHDSHEIRDETRRAVQGRVAAAEEAASQVLEEARALSSGLRQLGETLSDQGARILREVQAAHRRMQGDLRVGQDLEAGAEAGSRGRVSPIRGQAGARSGRGGRSRSGRRDDFDLPSWVDRP